MQNILDVVAGCVDDGEQQKGVGDLAMEPQVFVQRQEPDLWPHKADQRPTDG